LGNLKQTKTIVGHNEGISAITGFKDSHYIMTGGYDGIVKCWDLRKFQCVLETKVFFYDDNSKGTQQKMR